MSSTTFFSWPTLLLLQAAGDEAGRPEYSVLRPLLIGVVVVGLLIGAVRFLWRGRGGGGRPTV